MELALAVLSPFALAAAAPAIYRLTRPAAGWLLALLPLALAVYFALLLGDVAQGQLVIGWPWVPSLGLSFTFLLDGLSLLFALLISGIGAVILVYTGGYLAGDARLGRLYCLLLIFMGSMLGLVLSNNVLTLFVFWELTSISSYLLIGFDHEQVESRGAALQALLVTAGGGLALLAGLLLLGSVGATSGLSAADSFELSALLATGDAVRTHANYLPILILILAGAFTKSAQTPFHFWLPSAMQAPTPVSAYLHSATMVKAGVYLLARLSPILAGTDHWYWLVTGFGTLTMLVGAILAIQQTDLKRILAYSTVAALGMLVMLLGVGTAASIAAAVAFLLAHALYKGTLFLVAGGVDHATGTRNLEQLSGLCRAMPLTALAAGIAALSMAGLPPLFGFISKELFYEATLHAPGRMVLTGAAVFASMLFLVVAIMVGVRPFFGRRSEAASHAHEGGLSLWLGPMVLAGLGLALGLSPALADHSLLSLAAGAAHGAAEVTPLKLALWHGWNEALVLSIGSFVGGLGLFAVRRRLRIPQQLLALGPTWVYERTLVSLNYIARKQTDILQSGYLRYYLLITLLTLGILVTYSLEHGHVVPITDWADILPHEAAIALLIVLSALAAVIVRSRLSAIAAMGVVGFCVALIYVLFGAPDLAMTQFLVETLTVILFVLVFYHLPPPALLSDAATRVRDAVVAVFIGGTVAILVMLGVNIDMFPRISGFYGETSLAQGHGRNVVNVILVDYRALDTLGEITVLSVAGVGVLAILKLRLKGTPRVSSRPKLDVQESA